MINGIKKSIAIALIAVVSAVSVVLVSSPAAAASTPTPCDNPPPSGRSLVRTEYFVVADEVMRLCWTFHWVGSTARWRPDALWIEEYNAPDRRYSVVVQTNSSNSPIAVILGDKVGNASWGVPASYNWDMTSGVESTTTRIKRSRPNRGDCVARVRHDRYTLFVMDVIGDCEY